MSTQITGPHGAAATPPSIPKSHPGPPRPHRGRGWMILAGLVVVGAVAGGGWYYYHNGRQARASTHEGGQAAHTSAAAEGVNVEVVRPKRGGLERTSDMTGSVHPYESADLYANVSGYLKEQVVERDGKKVMVDIGVHVEQGEVLAEIDVPEIFAARDQAKADVEQAEAQAKQAEASVDTAEADVKAAEAGIEEAEADVGRYKAQKNETYKAYQRYKGLRGLSAVDQDVVDQKEDAYESAVAAEKSAKASVTTAKAKVAAAEAKVEQAKADLKAAESSIAVAKAKLDKAKIFVEYTKIRSPYTGVVTLRGDFRGDYIRAASEGNTRPLFNVARTDLMRVVTKVPDKDVPYVDVGDPAVVTIDALPGEQFQGTVARFSEAEIPNERTMITEIDLPNDPGSPAKGRLREGMYGLARIQLTPPSDHLSVPTGCLVGPAEGDANAVLVARDGKARKVKVKTGADNGIDIEILSGLDEGDRVIIPNGSVADGTPVIPAEAKVARTESSH